MSIIPIFSTDEDEWDVDAIEDVKRIIKELRNKQGGVILNSSWKLDTHKDHDTGNLVLCFTHKGFGEKEDENDR